MTAYLLDTNHLGAALESSSGVFARISTARRNGDRFGTCSPVLCELAVGIAQTVRRDENWKLLFSFLHQVRIWPIEMDAVRIYGDVYRQFRSSGRVLSQVDMMVAALARQAQLIILTSDRDFEAVQGIRSENWL